MKTPLLPGLPKLLRRIIARAIDIRSTTPTLNARINHMPSHNADQLGKSEETTHQRTCATCNAPLPSLDEYHSAWCRRCELKPSTNWKARAVKAEEENKSLIVKKSARESLLMQALLQGSAEGAIFTGTALNDWLDHAKRVPPHQFVSFEDSLSRETTFLARAEKAEAELTQVKALAEDRLEAIRIANSRIRCAAFAAEQQARAEKSETEIEAQRLRLCRAGLVPSRHHTLAAAVDGALAIVTVLREHLADPPADVQIAVLEKMRRQDLWQQRIERKHPAPPSEWQARAEKAEAVLAELMALVPFGNLKTHTRENLPGRVQDFLTELVEMTSLAEKSEEELAKREKALEESLFVIGAILAVYHLQFAGEEVEREIAMAAGSEAVIKQADMVPHLAEWLKQRGGK